MEPFHRLFEQDPASEPFASDDVRGDIDEPDRDGAFEAFRQAWRRGADLPDLFGRQPLALRAPVMPFGPHRKADLAKLETFLDRTGHLDLTPTEGPTGQPSIRLDDAIRDFQAERGLMVDGVVNPKGETHRSLAAALRPLIQTARPQIDPERTTIKPVTPPVDSSPRPTAKRRSIITSPSQSLGSKAPSSSKSQTSPTAKIVKVSGGSAANPLAVEFDNAWLAAQQGTSPHVIGADGRYNYQLAPEDWQEFYRQTGLTNQKLFVTLIDPRDGRVKVFHRNPKLRESRILGLSRALTSGVGILPSVISKAPRILAFSRAVDAVFGKHKARFNIASFIRNAPKALKAKTPRELFTPAIWDKLSPEMKRLIGPRFRFFTGRAGELKVGDTLETAGFTVTIARSGRKEPALRFSVIVNGQPTTRIYDALTKEQLKDFMKGLFVRPGKSNLPAGIEVKFSTSPIMRSQTAKDEVLEETSKIVGSRILRVPASRLSKRDLANAINDWLVAGNSSRKLSANQKAAFEELVGALQKQKLPDGSAMTAGAVLVLGLWLALKIQAQPDVPPAPDPGSVTPRRGHRPRQIT